MTPALVRYGFWAAYQWAFRGAGECATHGEIDALVYELYGLTEEEIAIVEGRDH